MSLETKGSCNCGGVNWKVTGKMRPITACHCKQCQKQSGFYYAASAAEDQDLEIIGDKLTWYQSSEKAKRGFCSICGSALFWKHTDDSFTSILAGSIDGHHELEIAKHIFVSDKGSYYEILDGKPKS